MGLVTLNIDAGEFDDEPEELFALAHIVNVACTGHAGDDASMKQAVDRCLARGASLGAHPSYPDRQGFGRVRLPMSATDVGNSVRAQCEALVAIARPRRANVGMCKLHGALYHAANEDEALARACVQAAIVALGSHIAWIGPPNGAIRAAAANAGVSYLREGFADRAVRPDGSLVPRSEPGALIEDPRVAAGRAKALVASVDTVCVHGDTIGAIAIARAVRGALDDAHS